MEAKQDSESDDSSDSSYEVPVENNKKTYPLDKSNFATSDFDYQS